MSSRYTTSVLLRSAAQLFPLKSGTDLSTLARMLVIEVTGPGPATREAVGDQFGPRPYSPSPEDPAAAPVPPTPTSTPSFPVTFERLGSKVHELLNAVDRADPNIITLLKATLVSILALGDIAKVR